MASSILLACLNVSCSPAPTAKPVSARSKSNPSKNEKASVPQTVQQRIKLVTKERRTALGKGLFGESLCVSRDGKRIAYARLDKNRVESNVSVVIDEQEYVIDGDLLKCGDGVWLLFSPDSKRLAYISGKENAQSVVVDGIKGQPYEGIGYASLRFSPDGQQLVYCGTRSGKSVMILNGQEGEEFEAIGDAGPIFSPDSKRMAYTGLRNEKLCIVVDGIITKEFDNVLPSSMLFSPDSKRLAYVANRGDKWVVVDGKIEHEYDDIPSFSNIKSPISFSSDSKQTAYAVMREGRAAAIFRSSDGSEREVRDCRDVVFSPDSQHVAFAQHRDGKWVIVVDGEDRAQFDAVGNYGGIAFSPGSDRVICTGERGDRWLTVLDGVEGSEYEGIGQSTFRFSADGKRVAYTASRGTKHFVVVNGVEEAEYDAIAADSGIVFSPSGKHVAYFAQRGKKWFVVLDGVEGKENDWVRSLNFSPDERSLAYVAGQGLQACFVDVEVSGLNLQSGKLNADH